jgi:hypothetical protein
MKQKSQNIRKTKKVYRARINFGTNVTIHNTNFRVMRWLSENFGGVIYTRKRQKIHWDRVYTWYMTLSDICSILSQCLPYLVIKKEQAILMIEARKSFDDNQKCLLISDEIYNRRLEIAKLIRLHNKKILPPCFPSA